MTNIKTLLDAFDDIKNSEGEKQESSFKDIMKFQAGNTYLVRLIPNLAEGRKTRYHYFHHSWTSNSTGQFVTALCPTTYGESCPIDNYVLKIYRNGDEAEKLANKAISRKENWMVNAYIVSDPVNPENNGKIKVVRYGKELAKIIDSAISGEDAEEFGIKVFDVQNGCTLKIKCEAKSAVAGKSKYTTYVSSKFMSPSTLEEITDEKLAEIHAGVIDMTKFNKKKSSAELQRMLDEHFFCTKDVENTETEEAEKTEVKASTKKTKTEEATESVETSETADVDDDTDAKLKALLADLT